MTAVPAAFGAGVQLSGVIDSAGPGALVRARNAARGRNGQLVLAGPSRFVQNLLQTMRLHTAFRVFATVSQATRAVEGRAPDAVAGSERRRRLDR